MELLKNFVVRDDPNSCLSQLVRNPKLAVAISREYAHNGHLISNSRVHCFENFETVHEYALKFLMRKDFLHQSKMNRFIQMASAGGLIEKWRKSGKVLPKRQNLKRFYRTISMKHFYGIFLLIIILCVHASLLFILEIIVYKKAHERDSFRIWLIIEMIIDPYRHFWCENVLFWKKV